MSIKKKIFLLLILSLIGFGIGLIFKNSIRFNVCSISEPTCINNITRMGDELYYGAGSLFCIFLLLRFIPQAFSSWKKFAIWFIPLATLLFIFYPEPRSGDYFSPYPEQIFQWVSGLYAVVSVSIIGWSSVKKAKAK